MKNVLAFIMFCSLATAQRGLAQDKLVEDTIETHGGIEPYGNDLPLDIILGVEEVLVGTQPGYGNEQDEYIAHISLFHWSAVNVGLTCRGPKRLPESRHYLGIAGQLGDECMAKLAARTSRGVGSMRVCPAVCDCSEILLLHNLRPISHCRWDRFG